jgi:hypothetical protein
MQVPRCRGAVERLQVGEVRDVEVKGISGVEPLQILRTSTDGRAGTLLPHTSWHHDASPCLHMWVLLCREEPRAG